MRCLGLGLAALLSLGCSDGVTAPPGTRVEVSGRLERGSVIVLHLVADGDTVVIDTETRRIDMEVPDAQIADRLAKWKAPAPRYKRGVFAKYIAQVSSASEGAVTFVKS